MEPDQSSAIGADCSVCILLSFMIKVSGAHQNRIYATDVQSRKFHEKENGRG